MTRRTAAAIIARLAIVASLACVAVAHPSPGVAAAKDARPNVLILVADDLGYGDLGVQGSKDIHTPNIDSIASSGVRFTDAYVSAPSCSPMRAGLMTGRYPQRFGYEFNLGPPTPASREMGLPRGETTLAQRLKQAGYATALVGKWHLGNARPFQPQRRGFDSFFGFLGGSHSYFKWGHRLDPIVRGTEPVAGDEYLTFALAREAAAFLREKRDRPFFLYLAFNAVHMPLHAPEPYLARHASIPDPSRRAYAAMASALDDAVGTVLAALRESGAEENTLIFFLSDNGGYEGVAGSDNGPLRGGKDTTWEGGIRVPFFLQWKAKLPAGTTYAEPVIQLDVFPTALAAAGVTSPNPKPLDGVDLLPYLTGKEEGAPHDVLYWRFGDQMAIRKGTWKLMKGHAEGENALRAVADANGALLFDLKEDPAERNDLATLHADRRKELAAAWERWNADLVGAAWGPPAEMPRRKRPRVPEPSPAGGIGRIGWSACAHSAC